MAREFKPLKPSRLFDAHMGYCAREVTLSDLKSSPMKEAIKQETTPFFIKEEHGLVFTNHLPEKIKLLEILLMTPYMRDKHLPLYFVWPGHYESHVFVIESDLQLQLLHLLKGDEREKKLHDNLNELSNKYEELKDSIQSFGLALGALDMEVNRDKNG